MLAHEREDALADALSELLDNPDRWSAMGYTGREYVETSHSIQSVVDELLGVYRTVV